MEHITGLNSTSNGFSKRNGITGRVDCYVYVHNCQLIFAMDHDLYPGWSRIGFKRGGNQYELVDANDYSILYDNIVRKEVRRGKTLIKLSSLEIVLPFKEETRTTKITLYVNEMGKGVKLAIGIERLMNELYKTRSRRHVST